MKVSVMAIRSYRNAYHKKLCKNAFTNNSIKIWNGAKHKTELESEIDCLVLKNGLSMGKV